MVGLLEAIFLGIIQGITEWLPVSSSGHLVIIQEFLGIDVPLIFDIILHLGTVTVILIFFSRDFIKISKSFIKFEFKSKEGKIGISMIIGTIPIFLSGYFFYDVITSIFTNLIVVGISLIITGFILYISKFVNPNKDLTIMESFIIGIAQAIALIPGISRSGFTIGFGILRGIKKEDSFKFSFLLATPAILGATLFDIRNIINYNLDPLALISGYIAALVLGFFSLKLLSKIILYGKLHYFSYYCWSVGFLTIISFLLFR